MEIKAFLKIHDFHQHFCAYISLKDAAVNQTCHSENKGFLELGLCIPSIYFKFSSTWNLEKCSIKFEHFKLLKERNKYLVKKFYNNITRIIS